MRQVLAVAIALLWAQTALSQDTLETFKAGHGDPLGGFFLGTDVDSGRVAIRLPESLAGRMIYQVRMLLRPPVENLGAPVDDSLWIAKAGFTWGLATGTAEQPTAPTPDIQAVDLKSRPELCAGGWSVTLVEWPVLEGQTYWLVGYWQEDADFIRITQNQRDTSGWIGIWPDQGRNEQWGAWFSSGLMVEVAHGVPGLGTPSGVLDLSEPTGRGESLSLHASVSGGDLSISLENGSDWSHSPYSLQVVNVLGQTVVSQAGYLPDAGDLRIPWSANRPSGVYFCRIRLGKTSYSVPVVNVK